MSLQGCTLKDVCIQESWSLKKDAELHFEKCREQLFLGAWLMLQTKCQDDSTTDVYILATPSLFWNKLLECLSKTKQEVQVKRLETFNIRAWLNTALQPGLKVSVRFTLFTKCDRHVIYSNMHIYAFIILYIYTFLTVLLNRTHW